MAKDVYLARSHKVEVADSENAAYTEIAGLLDHKVAMDTAKADGTNRDDEGVGRHRVASRKLSVTISGFRYIDSATGEVDTGQRMIEDAAQKIYPDEFLWFRLLDIAGNEVFKWKASCVAGSIGSGGINDNADFSYELEASGYWYFYGTKIG